MRGIIVAAALGLALLPARSIAGAAEAQPVAQEITLNMLNQGEPDNLDPNRGTTPGGGAIVRQLFEPLLRLDDRLVPQPAAAESYAVSADGRTYTFHLRQDGRWSDGQSVTAQQFEYSWKRILDPSLFAPYAPLFVDAGILGADDYNSGRVSTPDRVGVQALDDWTLEIRLIQPFAALPDLAALWVVPPLRSDIVEADPDDWTQDPSAYVGNGPFKMAEWVHQDHLTLVPNPAYSAHLGWPKPTLTRISVLMSTDSQADMRAFQDSRRDWLLVPDAEVNLVLNDAGLASMARQQSELTTFWLSINNDHTPLNDPNVRRSLARAIDRTALIRDVATGVGMPMTSILPSDMPGFQAQAGQDLGFDAAAARALLAQAGFADSQGFSGVGLSFDDTPAGHRVAEFLHAQWLANLGIDVELRAIDTASYEQTLSDKDYDLAFGGWAADYPDPQDWFSTLFTCNGHNNRFGFCDPAFDQIVARADGQGVLDERLRQYDRAQTILVQDAVVAPLYAPAHLVLVKPWVQSVVFTGLDDYPGSLFLDRVQILPH